MNDQVQNNAHDEVPEDDNEKRRKLLRYLPVGGGIRRL